MNISKVSLLLLIIGILYCPLTVHAEKPKPKTKESKDVKTKLVNYCTIPGIYKEMVSGDVVYHVCYLLSAADCISIPCTASPYGPNGKVKERIVPPGLDIEEGRNFIVKHNQNGPTVVQYVNELKVEETEDSFIIHFN